MIRISKKNLYILIGIVVVMIVAGFSLYVSKKSGKPIITSMATGQLRLDTTPSGTVVHLRKEGERYSDKNYETPLELELHPGAYYFYCAKVGYLSSGERNFTIEANKTTKEDIKLDSDPAVDIEGDLEE